MSPWSNSRKVTTQKDAQGLWDYALRLIAKQDYSRASIEAKLRSRALNANDVPDILSRLEEYDFINDLRYAKRLYLTRRDQRHYGPLRLQVSLREKGISGDIIRNLLEEHPADWEALARQARAVKFGAELPDNQKEKARQLRFLQQRGFSLQQSLAALKADT